MTARAARTESRFSNIPRPFAVAAFLIAVCVGLTLRFFLFISRYAVNILYSDQWAFYTPLFQNLGTWQVFSWQHGAPREGLGLIATGLLANLTGWNSRGDAFAVGALISAALLLALVLKHRLFRAFTFLDVTIAFLFLTLFQYESLVVVPSLSYGAFPVLLIMLYCVSACIETPWMRYALLLILNFLLTYTGYGMFMAPVTIVLLAVDTWQSLSRHRPAVLPALAFVLACATGLSFLVGYHFNPAIPNWGFSMGQLAQYPLFVGLMLASFWGWHTMLLGQLMPSVAGLALLVGLTAILVYHAVRLARQGVYSNRTSLTIATLIAFTLLFCFGTALGRVPLGPQQAQVSRYLTLMIPGYLGVYFHLISVRMKFRQLALVAFLVMSTVGSLPIGIVEAQAQRVYENKEAWKRCYLQFEDIQECNRLTNWEIYPDPSYLPARLEYLKAHHLNLYLDAAPRP